MHQGKRFMMRVARSRKTELASAVLLSCFLVIGLSSDKKTEWSSSESAANNRVELHHLMAEQNYVKHGLYKHARYKKILLWNDAWTLGSRSNKNFGMGVGRNRYELADCPVYQCETSDDRTDITQYDAILFNQRWWNWTDLPTVRSWHQRYIFFSHEPPALPIVWDENQYYETLSGPYFNWTMTYRWDSDVIHPYAWLEPVDTLPLHPPREVYEPIMAEPAEFNYAAGRTKMVAMFSTNCYMVYSGRDRVIAKLEEYGVAIDKFGRCGNLTCGPGLPEERSPDTEDMCLTTASKTYKFYIAFHNSMCRDYVPERFISSYMPIEQRIISIFFFRQIFQCLALFDDSHRFRQPRQPLEGCPASLFHQRA